MHTRTHTYGRSHCSVYKPGNVYTKEIPSNKTLKMESVPSFDWLCLFSRFERFIGQCTTRSFVLMSIHNTHRTRTYRILIDRCIVHYHIASFTDFIVKFNEMNGSCQSKDSLEPKSNKIYIGHCWNWAIRDSSGYIQSSKLNRIQFTFEEPTRRNSSKWIIQQKPLKTFHF